MMGTQPDGSTFIFLYIMSVNISSEQMLSSGDFAALRCGKGRMSSELQKPPSRFREGGQIYRCLSCQAFFALMAAWAALRRAIGTRKGEQDT